VAVLQHACEVGMAWPQSRDLFPQIARTNRHAILPVFPHPIGDGHAHGAAKTDPTTHAADDLGMIALHFLALAPAMPLLAPGKLAINEGAIDRHAGRKAVDDERELWTV
jgi:hypothetical protein